MDSKKAYLARRVYLALGALALECSADDYRLPIPVLNAEECLRWAEETDNEEHRQAFLDMAVALATRRGSRRVGSEARDTRRRQHSIPRRLSKPTGQQSDYPMKEQCPAPNCARRSGYEPAVLIFLPAL